MQNRDNALAATKDGLHLHVYIPAPKKLHFWAEGPEIVMFGDVHRKVRGLETCKTLNILVSRR